MEILGPNLLMNSEVWDDQLSALFCLFCFRCHLFNQLAKSHRTIILPLPNWKKNIRRQWRISNVFWKK